MSKKIRTEVRLDREVHGKLKALAANSGLSMNQVVEGVLSWAASRGNPGRAICEQLGNSEVIYTEQEPTEQACWFGQSSEFDSGDLAYAGEVAFELDYSGTRAVIPWSEVSDAAEEG